MTDPGPAVPGLLLGTVVRLQVQAASLKVGRAPRSRYDPAPLHAVPRLSLDGRGVVGRTETGEDAADVHHPDHPASKNRGTNGVSVGFTGHYAAMRARFGDHLTDGVAGENVLVETEPGLLLGEVDLTGGLLLETEAGWWARLDRIVVATPCVEFTRYALRFPDDARPDLTVTDALRFLDDGMRGYYAALAGEPATVVLGARVAVPEPGTDAPPAPGS